MRGEVGELVHIGGEKGTVKFEVAVTGGTRTWTDEYTMLRIHRDIVTLRAPGRMMRSDALALDEATRHPPEHCVRFVVVIYEWRREGKRREEREREERTFTPPRDQQNHTPHTQFSKLKIFWCIVKSNLLPSVIRLLSRRRTQRT